MVQPKSLKQQIMKAQMKHRYSILHLQLILHYHAIAEPYSLHDPLHANSPAVQQYTQQLVTEGMLYRDMVGPSGYRTTERGNIFVEMLKTMPLPEVLDTDTYPKLS